MIRSTRRTAAFAAFLVVLAACTERAPEPGSSAAAAADVVAIRALLAEVERTFNTGDLEAAMAVFTDDAVIIGQGSPDIAGAQTIREMYAGMMEAFDIDAALTTEEIEVVGGLAYERGTYTLKLTDKASGQVVTDVENRHIHMLKRQPDGAWKTWRMMINSAEPPPGAQ
jgi:uncharacterized protein (TIGR02246 family)